MLIEKHPRVRVPSYIDDIALVVQGISELDNSRRLERVARTAFRWANENAVAFDDSKTELIHFHTRRAISSKPSILVMLPNNMVIKPGIVVYWLGIWFNRTLTFTYYIDYRINAARHVLHTIGRLVTLEWGTLAPAFQQLYIMCITIISNFGIVIW